MESIVVKPHAPTFRDFRGGIFKRKWFNVIYHLSHFSHTFTGISVFFYLRPLTILRGFLSSMVNPVISPGESITSHWWHHCDTTSGHVVVLLEVCKLVVFDHFAILKWGRVRGDSGKSEAAPVDTHCSIVHIGHKQKISSKRKQTCYSNHGVWSDSTVAAHLDLSYPYKCRA